MTTKKTFFDKYLKPALAFTFVIGLIGGGITYYINNETRAADVENRIPKTPKLMNKIEDHVNVVPSDVENYKLQQTLLEQQGVLIQQTAKMDSIYGFAIKTLKKDSIKELKIQKSRAGRDSTNKSIDKKLDFIIKKLDTINVP